MSTHRIPRRSLLAGAGGLVIGSVLIGCAEEPEAPPAVDAGPELAEPTPATTPDQFDGFVTAIHDAVAEADEKRSTKPLKPRVTGSAASFRKKAYGMIKKADEWAEELTRPGTELVVPITSVGAEFPRTALALVADEKKDGIPFFMILQQKDARSPYTTWGWAQQAVGVEMPTVNDQTVGAEPVGPDAEGLRLTPKKALELYAKVLSDGNDADKDDILAENPFQTETHKRIGQERKELNTGVEYNEAATIKERYSVVEDEIAGIRTEDGGAIVMGTFTSLRRVKLRNEATMSYAEENKYTKVIGKKSFTKEYIREYGTTVALYIPPKDSEKEIQPIGATQVAIGASGS